METFNRKTLSDCEAKKLGEELSEYVKDNVSASSMSNMFDKKFKDFLLDGASVNVDTLYIFNRLIENNKLESLRNYILAGADVNVKDMFNITPLYFALLQRSAKQFNRSYKLLLESGAKTDVVNLMNSSKPTPLSLVKSISNLDDYEKRILSHYFNYSFNDECIK